MKCSLILVLLIIFACCSAMSFAQPLPSLDKKDRIRLAEAFRLSDKLSEKIWPNWNRAPFAVLLITPENEFLIRHPRPPADFTEIGYDELLKSRIYWRKQKYNPSFLATFPAVSGSVVSTIVVGQAENTWVKTSSLWVITLLHEHFHQLQDSQPNFYQEVSALGISGGDQTGMWMLNYPFPYSDADIAGKFDKLAGQLARTLETSHSVFFQNELKTYLKMRKEFNDSLKQNDHKYLSFELWKEGAARYTEYQIAKMAAERYEPGKDFTGLADYKTYAETAANIGRGIMASLKYMKLEQSKREVVYSFGAGEALLLDRVKPGWKRLYFSDKFYLDKYFDSEK